MSFSNNYFFQNLSIVIPSLGNDILYKNLELLNNYSILPNEIIIMIPKEYDYKVKNIFNNNFKFILNEKKAQVDQRINGFSVQYITDILQCKDSIYIQRIKYKEFIISYFIFRNLFSSKLIAKDPCFTRQL